MTTSRTKIQRILAAVVGLGLLGAACGDDETASEGVARNEAVAVAAVDYGFEGVPARLQAGTALTLTNRSTREAHELVAVRLPDREQRSAAELVALPEPELMALFSGGPPALVLVAPPGGGRQVVAEGDGRLSRPGRYLLLCSVPTGADPHAFLNGDGPGPAEGGAPHFANGMFAEVVVH